MKNKLLRPTTKIQFQNGSQISIGMIVRTDVQLTLTSEFCYYHVQTSDGLTLVITPYDVLEVLN
jgi:hypothetical protein